MFFSGCVGGPFVARGAKGKEEYPQCWLGGTCEVSMIIKREKGGFLVAKECPEVHLLVMVHMFKIFICKLVKKKLYGFIS